jgi:7,8-dihydropterin-6-yl-methyl-4-(beta-D-ribofuranosyl)aminobenzene 5'-phosphate synthase
VKGGAGDGGAGAAIRPAAAPAPVRAVRLLSLSGDFATCTERSRGPVRRLGNMFEMRRDTAPLGVHGLSFLVEIDGGGGSARALFDCGLRGDVLAANARYLGARLSDVESILLSHGHPDHFGGLAEAARLIGRAGVPLILHRAALRHRCWTWEDHVGGRYRLGADLLRESRVIPQFAAGPVPVLGGQALFLTDIPRRVRYEARRPGGQVLFREGGRWAVDTTPDDGAVVIHVAGKGLVILTGCGHAGLINTVREAIRQTGVQRVHALGGGFHLCGASPARIAATIRDLRALAPRWLFPSHCSGLEFEAALQRAFPRGFALDSVGTEYRWES